MNNDNPVVTRKSKLLCILIIICSIFGNVINSGDFRVAGLVLNLNRVGIPLITLYFVIQRCRKKELQQYFSNKWYLSYGAVMLFWILYGGIMLGISRYALVSEGLKELLDLTLGLMLVYCITECCHTKAILQYFMKVIKVCVCVLCVVGLFEMILGIHFVSSKYAGSFDIGQLFPIIVAGMSTGKIYPFTTVFYGVNDFSAFLAIFFPLFFLEKTDSKNKKIRNIIMMLILAFIVTVEDANISLVAMVVAVIFWMILRKINRYSTSYLVSMVLMKQWVANWIAMGIISIKKLFGGIPFVQNYLNGKGGSDSLLIEEGISEITKATKVLSAQIQTAEAGYGSLYMRSMITLDALEMWVKSHLLGVGPGGFTNYLDKNGSRCSIVNPHNWWLEILSQYGIFVFAAYVGMLLMLFIKNIKNYLKHKDFVVLQIICILVAYVLASIAPSSFLGYHYQWIVPALALIAIRLHAEEEGN